MPNHIHILLSIQRHGRDDPAPTIGNITGYFKYQTTKEINIPGFWQRSYHDHIIRDKQDYNRKMAIHRRKSYAVEGRQILFRSENLKYDMLRLKKSIMPFIIIFA